MNLAPGTSPAKVRESELCYDWELVIFTSPQSCRERPGVSLHRGTTHSHSIGE